MAGMRSKARSGLAMTALALAAVGLLVSVPAFAQASRGASAPDLQTATGFSGDVTWNGVDVSTAGTVSSAISIDFSQSANLLYSWSAPTAVTINDARLQMFYFGFAIATRDVYITNPIAKTTGSVPLNWTPLSINYVLEGVYKLTASMIASNGTTMWSENFYVKGNAPLGFVALIPIVLIILMIYEVYALVRSGRYAALGQKGEAAPPKEPPASAPSPTAPSESAEGGGESNAPPSEGAPPSTGGSS